MAASKLPPAERAFRKREAARLRQQKCRERKRQQAALEKQLEVQHHVVQRKNKGVSPPASNTLKYEARSREEATIYHIPMPPLCPPTQRFSCEISYESFPSLGSEQSPSPSLDATNSNDEVMRVTSSPIYEDSPRCIATSVSSYSPYSKNVYRSAPLPPSPPLLPINESENKRKSCPPLQIRRSSPLYGPNEIEMDAVSAILSLKSEPANSLAVNRNMNARAPAKASNFSSSQGGQRFYRSYSEYYSANRGDNGHRHADRMLIPRTWIESNSRYRSTYPVFNHC